MYDSKGVRQECGDALGRLLATHEDIPAANTAQPGAVIQEACQIKCTLPFELIAINEAATRQK
jgi:hypothetical protein